MDHRLSQGRLQLIGLSLGSTPEIGRKDSVMPVATCRRVTWLLMLAISANSRTAAHAQEPRALSIIGSDYAFQAPDTITAGPNPPAKLEPMPSAAQLSKMRWLIAPAASRAARWMHGSMSDWPRKPV